MASESGSGSGKGSPAPDAPDSPPPESMPSRRYNKEEMLGIAMEIQAAGIRSDAISCEFNNEMGLFDPDAWIVSIWESECPTPITTKKKAAAAVAPVDRLKSEASGAEEIVLSPQRRSFGQGCRQSKSERVTQEKPAEQSPATSELLNQLFGGSKGGSALMGARGGPASVGAGQRTVGHPSAVIGAAARRKEEETQPMDFPGHFPDKMQQPPAVGSWGSQSQGQPPRQQQQRDALSWRDQMTGPMNWRKRGDSGGGGPPDRGGRRDARNRGNSGPSWGGRQESVPEWMDEDADEVMELGGCDEHEARKARDRDRKDSERRWVEPAELSSGRDPSPPPAFKDWDPVRDRKPPAELAAPKPNLPIPEKESDFAKMFGITPSQVDAGVDVLFPFMSGQGGGFLSGSSVSVPGQSDRVDELKTAGQSRFSRFFGSEQQPAPVVDARKAAQLAEHRTEAQRQAAEKSQEIMAKLVGGGADAGGISSILSVSMPPPPMQQPGMSLQEIEAKLRQASMASGAQESAGGGRALFGRREEEPRRPEEAGPVGGAAWQAAKGNPLGDPAAQAHLLQSLSKISQETSRSSEAAAHHHAALQQLLQRNNQYRPPPPLQQQQHQQQGMGFPPAAFGPGGGLNRGPPPPNWGGGPNPQEAAAMAILKAAAAASSAQHHQQPQPPSAQTEQTAMLLAQLMGAARRPPQPPHPQQNQHMQPPFGVTNGGNGGVPPPELYQFLAAQMRNKQQFGGPPPQQKPVSPAPFGGSAAGFLPLSVLKNAAAGRKDHSGSSDEEDNFAAKRMSVAGGTPIRGPPPQAPPTTQQQYLAMLQHQRGGDGGSGKVAAAMAQMARGQQLAALQAAAQRGDPAAVHALGQIHAAQQRESEWFQKGALAAVNLLGVYVTAKMTAKKQSRESNEKVQKFQEREAELQTELMEAISNNIAEVRVEVEEMALKAMSHGHMGSGAPPPFASGPRPHLSMPPPPPPGQQSWGGGGGGRGGGENGELARLFGPGALPPNARPLSLEEVERQAASQPFV